MIDTVAFDEEQAETECCRFTSTICAEWGRLTESYFPSFKAATIEMITAQGGIVGWAASTDKILEVLNA